MIQTHRLRNKYTVCMFVVILISLSYKLLFIQYPFHGLEYEDAYVFSDVARNLHYNYLWDIDPFQTKTCIDGSISNCHKVGTAGGHYMILPLILNVINESIGYSVLNIFILNYITSILVLYFFIKILIMLGTNDISKCISVLLLSTTPFLNIFNTSGLCETLSSLFVISTIYFFIKSSHDSYDYKKNTFWVTILFIVISFLTKRENLILLSLPILSLLILVKDKALTLTRSINLSILFAISSSIAIAYNMIARVNVMEAAESLELGVPTFNLANFTLLFPKYVSSFLHVTYFGITGFLFIATSVYVIFFHKKFEFKLIAILSMMYLIMYSSHYRSYYQVHFGKVGIFETLRYTSNYFPIACLCFGSLSIFNDKILNSYLSKKSLIASILAIYISFITYINIATRVDLSQAEYRERISPALETLKITNDSDWIVSDITSVFHLYSTSNRNFIDSHFTNTNRLEELNKQANGQIYLLLRKKDNLNNNRYPMYSSMISKLNYIKVKDISPDYELLKMVK